MPFLGVSRHRADGPLPRIGADRARARAESAASPGCRSCPKARGRATLNVNSIRGGQAGQTPQTPCVADRCSAIFDRRFLLEEGFEAAKREIESLLEAAGRGVRAPRHDGGPSRADARGFAPDRRPRENDPGSPRPRRRLSSRAPARTTTSTSRASAASRTASRTGPGILELAHQIDEYCEIEDLVRSTEVIALTLLDLLGAR